MKNKIKNKLSSNSICVVGLRAKRFLEKASRALGRCYDELNRRVRIDDCKVDRENRINEIRMMEAEDVVRFIDENTENELRELGRTIDRFPSISIDSRYFGITSSNGETKSLIEDNEDDDEDEDVDELILENFL